MFHAVPLKYIKEQRITWKLFISQRFVQVCLHVRKISTNLCASVWKTSKSNYRQDSMLETKWKPDEKKKESRLFANIFGIDVDVFVVSVFVSVRWKYFVCQSFEWTLFDMQKGIHTMDNLRRQSYSQKRKHNLQSRHAIHITQRHWPMQNNPLSSICGPHHFPKTNFHKVTEIWRNNVNSKSRPYGLLNPIGFVK